MFLSEIADENPFWELVLNGKFSDDCLLTKGPILRKRIFSRCPKVRIDTFIASIMKVTFKKCDKI